tara:strand:+ start:1390 stop:2094 length:705 start_codon:yes stop_codon:yes gene_type:complete
MERKFKGVWINSDVWLNPDLTATEKMLYAEIDSFTDMGSTFFKANETIATDMGVSISTVKRALSKLIQEGFVIQTKYNGRVRHLQSCDPPPRKKDSDHSKLNHEMDQNEPSDSSKSIRLMDQKEPVSKQQKKTVELTTELELPQEFEGDDFRNAWQTWKQYKKEEHRFAYKSPISEQTTIHKLYQDTNGSQKHAILAIGNAIARGWKGIFPDSADTSERNQPIDTKTALEWADS